MDGRRVSDEGWAASDVGAHDGNGAARGPSPAEWASLRREVDELRAITAHVPHVIARFDAALRHRYANPAAAAISGRTPAECIGRTMRELGIPTAHCDLWDGHLRAVFAHGEPRVLTFPYGTGAGTRWFEAQLIPERGADGTVASVVTIGHDVTVQRAATVALSEATRLLAQAESIAHVGSWAHDTATDAVWWSDELFRIYGHEPGTIPASTALAMNPVHPDDRAALAAAVEQAVRTGEPYRLDIRIRRPDGTERLLESRGAVHYDGEGRCVRMEGSAQDVTERRRLEEQVRQAQKMDAIGRLAGGVAHDFNNLLTAILTTADLALSELDAAHPVCADLDEIRHAGERAAALTRQLLAFSRRQVLRPQPLDVNTVVADTECLLRRVLGGAVQLETRFDPAARPVRADRGQLEQVLVNLAVNARDAMPRGGTLAIGVHAGACPPDEAAAGEGVAGDWVAISVCDTGVGMDDATRARIFEPFFTTKPVSHGTGLGLATVHGIVEQSGGRITVTSEPGRGSTFTVFLPAVAAQPAVPAAPDPVRAAPSFASGDTILLVEDEPSVRHVARRLLEREGYRVLEAADGVEALALHDRDPGAVDLVLSDVLMPRLGGLQLLERLRQRDPRMPVLLMSGYVDQPADPDHPILPKPLDGDALLGAIRAALAGARQA